MRLQQIVWEDGNSKSPWRINIAVRWKSCYSNFGLFSCLYSEWRITWSSVSSENYYETPFHFLYIIQKLHGHQSKTAFLNFPPKLAVFLHKKSKTGDFAKMLAQMKQTRQADCVCSLTDSDRFSWYTVRPPNPPLNHLSVMMDQTKFRPTNQSLSNVYLSVSYDLCLPVPPSSDSAQPQPSTLPGSVGNAVTHTHTTN